jgi:undecaprenyl-diphosphatase
MDTFQVLIFALVEGLTEFIPVSSTGHLILTSKLLSVSQTEFVKTFEIVIQSGAILSVIFLFWKKLLRERKVLRNVAFAFLPTAAVGFLLYRLIKDFLIGNLDITIAALLTGGILIIVIEKFFKARENLGIKDLTIGQSILIGLAQSISVIPGVSRSAATIIGGMFLGLSRKEAVEFSFLLAIPTMISATGYDLLKNASSFQNSQLIDLGVGFIASFVAALFAVKWFIKYVASNNLIPFGIYRIIIGIIFLLLFYI